MKYFLKIGERETEIDLEPYKKFKRMKVEHPQMNFEVHEVRESCVGCSAHEPRFGIKGRFKGIVSQTGIAMLYLNKKNTEKLPHYFSADLELFNVEEREKEKN